MSAARPFRLRRTILALSAALLVCSALAGFALWWWLSHPRPPELELRWDASVHVIAGEIRLAGPFGVAVAPDGTMYVSDSGEGSRILRITPAGRAVTLAGSRDGFADGPGASARFSTPSGVALDAAGNLFVADTGNNAIRRVAPDGHVSTVAGDGVPGFADGPASQARFNGPIGVAVAADGRVIVADTYNDRIRAIHHDGTVTTIAGSGQAALVDGNGIAARFHTPCGVTVDTGGTILVADTGNGLIRMIAPDGTVTTAPSAPLSHPIGIARSPIGMIYVADQRGQIVEVGPAGVTRIVAGSGNGFRDGRGRDAAFRGPTGVAVIAEGRLVVADFGNALLRLVAATAQLELRPPVSPRIDPAFDAARFGLQPLLWPVAPMQGPHEIAGTMGEARGDSAERLHSGIDVRIEQGTEVRVVRDGVVTSPIASGDFGGLNEWLRIGPVTYVHVRAGRTRRGDTFDLHRFAPVYDDLGALADIRLKRGARFATGDVVATVNAFNHVHMNVGWPGEEHNPLNFRLLQFEDSVAPTIPRNGVTLYDDAGAAFTGRARRRLLVSGRVHVVVEAWDQADGNRPGRRLGLYSLGYEVRHPDGSAAPGFEQPRQTMRFDRMPLDSGAPQLIFAPGSGIPFYGRRVTRFLYAVTNTFKDGRASKGAWDTTSFAPGDYTLRVFAADIRGNAATREVAVTVVE